MKGRTNEGEKKAGGRRRDGDGKAVKKVGADLGGEAACEVNTIFLLFIELT